MGMSPSSGGDLALDPPLRHRLEMCSDAGCHECRPGAKLMGGRAARRPWHPVRLGCPAAPAALMLSLALLFAAYLLADALSADGTESPSGQVLATT